MLYYTIYIYTLWCIQFSDVKILACPYSRNFPMVLTGNPANFNPFQI